MLVLLPRLQVLATHFTIDDFVDLRIAQIAFQFKSQIFGLKLPHKLIFIDFVDKPIILCFHISVQDFIEQVHMDQLTLLTVGVLIQVAVIEVVPDPENQPRFRNEEVQAG